MKKYINITLHMSEIIYRVENNTYLTGEARYDGQNYEQSANMKANADDENRNKVLVSIGNAFATLKTKVSEYLHESGTTASNAQVADGVDFNVCLAMPSNYNEAATTQLAAAMSQYIENIAIGEWFTIFSRDDAAGYITMAAANLTQIREALSKRVRPQRKPVRQPLVTTACGSGVDILDSLLQG